MPVDNYFKGSGGKVLGSMQDTYGSEKGKQVFYATANKRDMTPKVAKAKKIKDSTGAAGARRALAQ